MNWRALLWMAAMGLGAPAEAADWSGSWAARTADSTYEIVSISRDADAGDGWRVTISRPNGSWLYVGGMVGHLGRELETRDYHAQSPAPDRLEMVEPSADGDVRYRLSRLADGHLLLAIMGTGTELLLNPARSGESVSSDWPAGDVPLVQSWPDNPEMAELFERDQADRKQVPGKAIDWAIVGRADEARRARAQMLIDSGALHSGADFYHAAFLFQHGSTAEEYLKAHVLAVAAAARGYRPASWIAAASLDRYLQSKGRPQVFGTQFQTPADGPVTQEPYDRALLSDGLRAVAGVPSLADQQKERDGYEARRHPDRPAAASSGN